MGKASSNKKVARAARAGGGRARAAGERNVIFPAALAIVVILGVALVVYARDQRTAVALEAPLANQDHWHSSYAFYVCDSFLAPMAEFIAPQNAGTHTHGDGLIHIHPFATARAGVNATLGNFLEDAGEAFGGGDVLSDDELRVPGGSTFQEGEDDCAGLDGDPIVQVAFWDTAGSALAGDDPTTVFTEDLDEIRFLEDGQAFTIAFAPEGTDLPPPPTTDDLSSVSPDLGVPVDVPDDGSADPDAGGPTPIGEPSDAEGDAEADSEGSTDEDADVDQDAEEPAEDGPEDTEPEPGT